jgi:hypothetical protein
MLDSLTAIYTGFKDAANNTALDAKTAAIAKANATHGTLIESIGYGVLIP